MNEYNTPPIPRLFFFPKSFSKLVRAMYFALLVSCGDNNEVYDLRLRIFPGAGN